MFWDFITLRPETTHQVCFLFSDRGIPDGYQHMNGYGSHTFKMVNDRGEAVYCKFHVKVTTSSFEVAHAASPSHQIDNAIETERSCLITSQCCYFIQCIGRVQFHL